MGFINTIFPRETVRRRVAGNVARKLRILRRKHPDIYYSEWIERTEPFTWSAPAALTYNPTISVVVPIFNSPAKYLLPMIYSVVNQQHYRNWELILVNASSDRKCFELTKKCMEIDDRIKVVEVSENLGIAANTNAGVVASRGEYIALLDHDDTLAPQAIYEVAIELQRDPRPQIVYSDEDKVSEKGEYRFDPFFKPGWSPHLFRHVNYLNHFVVIEKKLIKEVGSYRNKFEGAQDYDLFLRLIDKKPVIEHIPKILYHWRTAVGSTAHNFESKKNIVDAGILALEEHLKRNRQKGEVSHLRKQPGFYSISYKPKDNDRVGIIILPSPVTSQYSQLVSNLTRQLKTNIEVDIVISKVDNLEVTTTTRLKIKQIGELRRQEFIEKALAQTSANILIFVNSALSAKTKNWVNELAGLVSQVKTIGVATPLIIDEASKTIVDAGYVQQGAKAISLFQGLPDKANTYLGNTVWGRNIDKPSNRVIALRREIYEKYFNGSYPSLEDNSDVYKRIRDDSLEVAVCMNVVMGFNGDLEPSQEKSNFYSQNLVDFRGGIKLPKTINLPPEAHQ